MAQEIQLPVRLQLENLQQIAKEMRGQLTTLKVDSSSYQRLKKVIDDIEKRIQNLQVASSKPFVDQKQFVGVEKELNSISDDITKIGIEASKVKFSDISLDASQKAKIQEFNNEIKNLNDQLKNVKERAKNTFLESDIGQAWKVEHPEAVTQSFAQITNAINKEVKEQQKALDEAKIAYEDYQTKMSASKKLNAFMKNNHELNEANLGQELYDKIFNEKGFSTAGVGGRKLLTEWLKEQFKLDDSQIEPLVKESGNKVKEAFAQVGGEVEKVLKQQQINFKNEKSTSNNGQNYVNSISAAEAALNSKKQTQQGVVDANVAVAKSEDVLGKKLDETKQKLAEQQQVYLKDAQSKLTMGNSCTKASQQVQQFNSVTEQGKQKLSSLDSATNKLQGISNFISRYVGAYAIIRKVTQAIRNAFSNIKELDKVITNIAVVTNMSQQDLWGKIGQYTQMAQEYGVATKDVYTVSQLFYQQGLQTNQVMSLTTETLKMAKIAGMDYTEATNAMTVAIRAFNIDMQEAQQVTDTYSALAAKFAVSSAEIANAMEKTASSAANVGMSLQSTSAFISVMEQTTRESAQNIGSALKSIISRYGEMKASPDTLINVDGEEVAFNKVDTALQSIGVSIKDATGQFRDFDDVILELASKWDTLDNNTQRYIATVMAGNRQQSRFIALVSNYDELKRAIQTANDAENASIVQVAKTMDSLESKAQQLKNAFSQIYLDLHVESGLKDVYDWLTRILKTIGKLGMLKGVLPTLLNVFGFGSGLKNSIKMVQDAINAKKLKPEVDTSEAKEQIKAVQQEAQTPQTMPVTVEVDKSQIIEAKNEIAAVRAESQLTVNNVMSRMPSAITGNIVSANSDISNTEIKDKLLTAFQHGDLKTGNLQQQFLASLGLTTEHQGFEDASNALAKFVAQLEQASNAEQQEADASLKAAEADLKEAQDNVIKANEKVETTAEIARKKDFEVAQTFPHDSEEERNELFHSTDEWKAYKQALLESKQAQDAYNEALKKATSAGEQLEQQLKQDAQQIQQEKEQREKNTDSQNKEEIANEEVTQSEKEETAANKDSANTSRKLSTAIGIASSAARMLGTVITAAGASHQDKSTDAVEGSKLLTGIGNGISMAGTGASMGMAAGPWGALIGGVAGLLIGGLGSVIDAFNFTISEKIELAKQEAESVKNESLKAQAKVIDVKSSIDNIKQLQKTMYNSTEDMKAYKDAMNTLGEQYPELISSYDAQGNAIINLSDAEMKLAELRQQSAQAARDAAMAEIHQHELELVGYKEIEKTVSQQTLTNIDKSDVTKGTGWDIGEVVANIVMGPWFDVVRQNEKDYDRHGNNIWERLLDVTAMGGSSLTEKNNIINVKDQNDNLIPVISTGTYTKGGPLGDYATGVIDYMGAIQEYAKTHQNESAEYTYASPENLSYEEIKHIAWVLAGDSEEASSEKYNQYKKNTLGQNTQFLTTDWSYYFNQIAGENGYEWNVDEINEQLKEYTTLFGKEVDVISLLGEQVGDTLTSDELTKLNNIIKQRQNLVQKQIDNSRQTAGMSAAEGTLFDYSRALLNVNDNTEIGDNKIYSKLFYQMVNSKKGSYKDVYDLYSGNYSLYSEIAEDASKKLFDWFTNLSQSQRELLEQLDFTAYTNIDDIARKLNITNKDSDEYNALLQEFTDNNQTNKDRILEVIYDDSGLKRFNQNLRGLKAIDNLGYSADGGIIGEGKYSKEIADAFDNNKIISKYSEYFTQQLLSINDLAEDGYTELASGRLDVIYKLASTLSEIKDSNTQNRLFSTISKIDFSNYDSIISAQESINKYIQEFGETDELNNILSTLDYAIENLLFNINTLAQSLVDQVSNSAKEIDSILGTNKTGLDLSKALDKLSALNISKEANKKLNFNEVFQYDAILGKYVYTVDGLEEAIAQNEKKIYETVQELLDTNELYKIKLTYLNDRWHNFDNKEFAYNDNGDSIINSIENYNELSNAAQELYRQLAKDFLADERYQEGEATGANWLAYLEERRKIADKATQDAMAEYDAAQINNANQYFQNIDWTKLGTKTDYNKTNLTILEKLANELDMRVSDGWEAILDKYLRLYGGNEDSQRVLKAQIKDSINSENINRLTTAISEVLNAEVNQYFSVATQELLDNEAFSTNALSYALDDSLAAAKLFLDQLEGMIDGTTLTLEQYNASAKQILEKGHQFDSLDKSVLEFASGTIDDSALESLANTFGIKLTELVDITTGEILNEIGDVLVYNGNTNSYDISGTFSEFIDALNKQFGLAIDKTSQEYIKILKTFNDNKLKKETEINDNIVEEFNKTISAKTGDKINLAQTYTILEKALGSNIGGFFEDVGKITADGILEITNASKIPATIKAISDKVQQSQKLLPEEIAKLNDALQNAISSITNILKSGISGGLNYTDRGTLESWANDFGLKLDFEKTKDGFKLTTNSAIELYNELKKIDALQAELVFNELNKSLQETNEHYKNISDVKARIVELDKKIKDPEVSNKRKEQYEAELEVAKEIYAVRSTTEDSSFDFMSGKIPGAQNNPINYFNSWIKGWNTLNDALKKQNQGSYSRNGKRTKSGFIDYQDWYNLVNEMNNIAKLGGQFEVSGVMLDGSLEAASELIQKGAASLVATDTGEIKVALNGMELDFSQGTEGFADGVTNGIQTLAKSQVEMLDGMIQLMETVVAMGKLGDIAGENNTIDLSDLFPEFTVDANKLQLKEDAVTAFADMLSADEDSDLGKALKAISWGGKNLKEWITEAQKNGLTKQDANIFTQIMNSFYQMYLSGDYNLDNIMSSIREILGGTDFEGDLNIGDWKITVHQGTVLERVDGGYKVGNREYDEEHIDEAVKATKAGAIDAFTDSVKTYNEDGSVTYTGKLNYTIIYDTETGYEAKIDGTDYSITASSISTLKQALQAWAEANGINEENSETATETKKETFKIKKNGEILVQYDINDNQVTFREPQTNTEEAEMLNKLGQIYTNKLNVTSTVDANNEYAAENPAVQAINPENNVEAAILANQDFAKNHSAVQHIKTIIDNNTSEPHAVVATGNLAHAKGTLMGELGPELVVSGGKYFVVGQTGPEMVDLANDAIVFNHLQTKSLLEKGMSTGRGQAVTNERNAVSFATGNVHGGPAKAGASAALSALKELRAQWQALAGLNIKDLATKGGSGGGGGGDKQFIKDLERWYNWLQEIAKLEKLINYEEAKRSRIQSDFNRSGQEYYQSQKNTLEYLERQLQTQKDLTKEQHAYFETRRAELNAKENPFSSLYEFDEYGQIKYKSGKLEEFSKMVGTNEYNTPNMTPEEQYKYITETLGIDEKYMQYSSSGEEIDKSDYAARVQAFWDKIESDQSEMQNLYDSVEEGYKTIEELTQKENEILKEIEDNQIAVENRVLAAVEDAAQREIDELQKERDALEKSNTALINGLTNALNKERTMYQNQESETDLETKRRRLAILQRSGGSASEISSLQAEIDNSAQELYFAKQQEQIDAIQEASDKQLEKLDAQIDLQTETLEYQKEHGLLWNEVYEHMVNKTPEEIATFIEQNDSKHWGESPTAFAQTNRDIFFEADKWVAYVKDKKDADGDVTSLLTQIREKLSGEEATANRDKIKSYYSDLLGREGTEEELNYWADQLANGMSLSDIENTFKGSEEYKNLHPEKQESVETTKSAVTGTQQWKYEKVDDKQHRSYQKMSDGTWKNQGLHPHNWKDGACKQCKAAQPYTVGGTVASSSEDRIPHILKFPGAAEGGFVEQGGLAKIHSNEVVLTAEQTSFLREQMLGNRSNSLINLLSDLSAAYGNINNSTVNNSDNVNSIVIEHAEVNMKVDKLADSYDASKAADDVMREMLNIARKTSAQNRIGR